MPHEREWDVSVSHPSRLRPAERDDDLSDLWGADTESAESEVGTPLKMWGAVLLIVAVAWWVGLAWAIFKWG